MKTNQRDSREEYAGAPTPERRDMLNGHLIDRPIYDNPTGANRVPIGTGYRIATPIMKMHLDKPENITLEMLKAADMFYKDYNHGVLSPRVCGRYGVDLAMAGLGRGGTPLSQVKVPEDPEAAKRQEREEEPHIKRAKRYASACAFIGHRPTVYWLTAVVCEVPVDELAKVPTIEDVGRAYAGYASRQHAMAAGYVIIKSGLERLEDFYLRG